MNSTRTGIGRTPQDRVKWAIRFCGRDITRLSAPEQERLWRALYAWQRRSDNPARSPGRHGVSGELQRTRKGMCSLIENFTAEEPLPDMVYVPEMSWSLWPPRRRAPGERRSGSISREPATVHSDEGLIGALVVLAFVDDLNVIGADRLRACPLETNGKRCGVVFLATRRQVYCSDEHAQAAAWQKYAPIRKLRSAGVVPPAARRRRRRRHARSTQGSRRMIPTVPTRRDRRLDKWSVRLSTRRLVAGRSMHGMSLSTTP
jgi:hypothetical protein